MSPPPDETPLISVQLKNARSQSSHRLDLPAGGSCVLLGAAGSGKSRVIEAIALAASTAAAQVNLFGEPCERLSAGRRAALQRRLGIMFQDLRLADELSVIDNLAFAARAAGRRLDDYRADALEVLTWVGLRRRLLDAAADLDPEARRRLALARALLNGPEALVVDEPTDQLPAKARNALLRLIGEAHSTGVAVLLATRDASLAEASGGEVTALDGAGAAALAGAA